ncbi:hypothetical protein BEWA_020510 [Theileria equi strain WA]|uniref:Uncharacterized protein n=1 Tax=Theileria equi strain WA TaxID=1537102 RepID=L0AWC0_THEEQ|nr:hypothetical protein BEWA_020510 [Theileria equi strain WA]AFZ79204.1 hypothetical protein BEWA_020510 [Theileria equi strain WA]|eukprot:XP_004828870.1 hypothetical protein BEWA_020510 [Theileria equi strain WA]
MNKLYKHLGVSIKGGYLSYCLIFEDKLSKVGCVSLKCSSEDHVQKIGSALALLKHDGTQNPDPSSWAVAIQSDLIMPRSYTQSVRLYNMCRLRSIVECHCNSLFGVKPVFVKERELHQIIAKVTKSKISNHEDLLSYAKKKLNNYFGSVNSNQLSSIAVAWASAISVKRMVEIESLKLDEKIMSTIEQKIKQDKIVKGLVQSLEQEIDQTTEKEIQGVLKSRINKLVDYYIQQMV